MNTYIQDKLDEVMKNIELGGNVKANIEKALTDYHNHIVEEIDKHITISITPETKLEEIESYKLGAKSMKQQILISLLQDTKLTNS